MSYTSEREQFIARMAKEGLSLDATLVLLRQATTIHRLAEMACSSETADRDRIPCPCAVGPSSEAADRYPCLCDYDHEREAHTDIPRISLQDYRAEQRAIAAVPAGWRVITEGDPRGYTLRVIPPSYTDRNAGRDRFNLESIGVPARESGIRW